MANAMAIAKNHIGTLPNPPDVIQPSLLYISKCNIYSIQNGKCTFTCYRVCHCDVKGGLEDISPIKPIKFQFIDAYTIILGENRIK